MSDEKNSGPPPPPREPQPIRVPGKAVKAPSVLGSGAPVDTDPREGQLGERQPVPPPPPTSPQTPTDPLIGRNLAGKYAFKRKLGSGGFGSVYLARHATLGGNVAVKVLAPRRQDRKDISQRFRREAKTLSRLRHPHIVEVLDFGNEDGLEYLVMEFLEGQELADLVTEPMEWRRSLHIVKQIALALAVAHNVGIVHRDLKPANVMLVEIPGFRDHVKVLDFGIAKLLSTSTDLTMEDEGPTQGHQLLGTPTYMSPEQCRAEDLDGRADLYSLGALLFRMLTGVAPFSGTNVVQVIAMHLNAPVPSLTDKHPSGEFPAGLQDVIDRLLAKSPEERYATAEDVIKAIEAVERGEIAGATGTPQPAPEGRRLKLVALGAVAILAVAGVVALSGGEAPAPVSTVPVETSVPPTAPKPAAVPVRLAPVKLVITTSPPGVKVSLAGTDLGSTPVAYEAKQDEKTLLDTAAYSLALAGHTVGQVALTPSRDVDGRLTEVKLVASMEAVAPAAMAEPVSPSVAPTPPPKIKTPPPKRSRRAGRRAARDKGKKPTPQPALTVQPKPKPKPQGLIIDEDL